MSWPAAWASGPSWPHPVIRPKTSRGLRSRQSSGPRPRRSMTPGRKPSIKTSAESISLRTSSTPSADFRSTAIERRPRDTTSARTPMAGVRADVVSRGRRSIAVDLKSAEGVELVLKLIDSADVLIEGFRPGVMERLGLGPELCLERNPRLVFGRMTGWGQDGPLAQAAGHDINYISLSGALAAIGRQGEAPVPPLNLVGDYGGGGLMLAYGVLAALLSAARTGTGQVVDAAMLDGSALLMAQFFGMQAIGRWTDERGSNLLDTGAPFYDVYPTADGGYLSVGPLEPAFFATLLGRLGIDDIDVGSQYDPRSWPVLSISEAPQHPHNVARCTFVTRDDVVQPAPSPRFSATPARLELPPPAVGEHTDEVLADLGLSDEEVLKLRESGVVGSAEVPV